MSNEVTVPSDEEMHRLFHEEARRAMDVLWKPIAETLDEHGIGEKLPPRIAAAVALHALTLLGVTIAAAKNLPLEATSDVLRMVESRLRAPGSPFDAAEAVEKSEETEN